MREDIDSQKVYYYDYRGKKLLYDFSLRNGDVISTWYASGIAENVDSVTIETKLHKRILFTNGVTWIEGVGDLNGPVSKTMPFPLCGIEPTKRTLLCVFNNSNLIYKPIQ